MGKKNSTIEILRIVAIWAVVGIHTTSRTLTIVGFQYSNHAIIALYVNQLLRFAVPLFFIISGYVLMTRYETEKSFSLSTFYKRRVLKLFLPFLIWSGIYYSIVNHNSLTAFIFNLPNLLLYGSAADQLYFIPSILLLYLLFPLLLKIVKKHSFQKHTFWYLGGFVVTIVLLFSDYYSPHLPLATPIRIALLNFPLFLIGMLAKQYQQSLLKIVKRNSVFITFSLLISLLLILNEGTVLFFYDFNRNSEYFTSQWRPTVFIYTLSIFALATTYISIPKRYKKIINYFSQFTFFIFFIHQIFIHVFWRLWGAYLFSVTIGRIGETVWFDAFVFLFVLICSYLSAYLVSFIPKLRNLLGISA